MNHNSLDSVAIAFDILTEATDHPVVTLRVDAPAGMLLVMAEVTIDDRAMRLHNVHVQGDGANRLGLVSLRRIAAVVMERMDLDELRIEGALRTSGAGPGRHPRPLRFARRAVAPPGRRARPTSDD